MRQGFVLLEYAQSALPLWLNQLSYRPNKVILLLVSYPGILNIQLNFTSSAEFVKTQINYQLWRSFCKCLSFSIILENSIPSIKHWINLSIVYKRWDIEKFWDDYILSCFQEMVRKHQNCRNVQYQGKAKWILLELNMFLNIEKSPKNLKIKVIVILLAFSLPCCTSTTWVVAVLKIVKKIVGKIVRMNFCKRFYA